MKKVLLFLALFLVGCGSVTMETPLSPQASPESTFSSRQGVAAFLTTSPTPSVTLTPSPDLYAEIHVEETALALRKEQVAAAQLELGLQLTKDAATSTAGAQMT